MSMDYPSLMLVLLYTLAIGAAVGFYVARALF
jgi:uncharacterized protein YneF (UPF0154 family)